MRNKELPIEQLLQQSTNMDIQKFFFMILRILYFLRKENLLNTIHKYGCTKDVIFLFENSLSKETEFF